MTSLHWRRRALNRLMMGLCVVALAFGLFWLAWILAILLWEGIGALRPARTRSSAAS
jgi:phosphate transport system permease protein